MTPPTKPNWWSQITPAGLIVTGTAAGVTVLFALAAVLAVAFSAATVTLTALIGAASTSLTATVALLARTRQDPPS